MICVCGGGKYPTEEINFITSILSKFHEDPALVNLFISETPAINGSIVSKYRVEMQSQHELSWRNWLARSTVNRKVAGSSPAGSDTFRITI